MLTWNNLDFKFGATIIINILLIIRNQTQLNFRRKIKLNLIKGKTFFSKT